MVRCFKKKFLHLFFVAISFSVAAQITGNLNVKDPRAMEITPVVIKMLCEKTWYPLQIHEIKRDEKRDRDSRSTIKFLSDGDLYGKNGKWEVVNQQFIKAIPPPERKNFNYILNGAYSIYEISDTTLVLAQVLTSNGDWVKEFTFTSSQEKYQHKYPPTDYSKYWRNLQTEKKAGENITRHDNGNIGSKEYYKWVKRPSSVTELFERNVKASLDSPYYDVIPTGNWIFYYPDGKIKSTSRYNDEGRMTDAIDYSPDEKIDHAYHYKPNGSYSDYFEYKSDRSLLHVKRHLSNDKTLYLVGKSDSIGISKIELFIRDRAGQYRNDQISLFNLSDKEVKLTLNANNRLGFATKQTKIGAKDSLTLYLPINVPRGSEENFLSLSTKEWAYKIKIHSFGFDLTTSDFETGKSFVLPSTFYFYLEPEGYQLEILPLSNPTRKKTIPISQQLTEIQLKKDKYQLILHSPSGKRTISVEVK